VLVEDAGPPAGSVAGEQFFGAGGAGEPADGVAGKAELDGDIAEVPPGQQPVHAGVPGPGPVCDPPCPRRRWCGRRGRLGSRVRSRGRRRASRRQVLPVPGDGAFHGVAEVVPQVPPAGDLDRARCAPRTAVGIAAGAVPADDLRTGAGRQPGGERISRPAGQHIDRAA
jgi:hypothetical protein